jgi:uncharacterized membrane protein YqjE
METRAPGPSSVLGSLRGFAEGLLGSVHDRLELLAIEAHEEKHRLIQIVVWISAVVVFALLAIIFASLALLVIFWDTARVLVVSVLAGVYVVAAVATGIAFRRFMARQTKPFSATLGELKEDRSCTQNGS